jgi:NAD(P)-dependent dehydrogenase (short-subunit alcohol dehydrogenase family)
MSRIFKDDALAGKVAIVTGGGTGIGAATARELGSMGATIVIASRKMEVIARAAAGLSKQLGRTVHGLPCDVRDRQAVTTLVQRVLADLGRIDILVNNGGGQFFSPAEAISDKGWDAVVATNLTGQWNLLKAVANAWMLERGGCVVNITMLTRGGFAGMAHSVAARAGVEGLTRTLAVEWASRGVRVNCVAPGLIASSGLRRYPSGEQFAVDMQRTVPQKRLGTVVEIAEAIAFACVSEHLTGQVLTVDGGRSQWGDHWIIPDPSPLPAVEIPREEWEE